MILRANRDILALDVIFCLVVVTVAMAILRQHRDIMEWIGSSYILDLLPLKRHYVDRLRELNMNSNDICYIIASLSENFLILTLSFVLSLFSRLHSGYYKIRIVVVNNWPIKSLVLWILFISYALWYNFDRNVSLLSLNVDRPFLISIIILTCLMGSIFFISLHLLLHFIRVMYQKFVPVDQINKVNTRIN